MDSLKWFQNGLIHHESIGGGMMNFDIEYLRKAFLLTVPLAIPLAALPVLAAGENGSETGTVHINEIQVSTSSTDWEFIELQGAGGYDISNLTLLVIESDADSTGESTPGTVDRIITFDSQMIGTDGLFLAMSPAAATAYGIIGDFSFANNSFENSSASYLLVEGFSGAEGDDLDTDDDGILDSSPWLRLHDSITLLDYSVENSDYVYAGVSVGPDGYYLPSGAYRCPDAPDGSFTAFLDFTSPDGTPGTYNCTASLELGECGDDYTPIYTIQGNGHASPFVGEEVVTEGVVVGDFQDDDGEKGGFYIQDAIGDGDASTSDGVFVYYAATDVSVGDHVRVLGGVSEYYNLTELSAVGGITLCSTGNELTPVDLYLPVEDFDDLEKYESMLVNFPQELNIAEFYNFDRYGEIVLSTERQFQPTAVFAPGSAEAKELALANSLARITLDDGRTSQNPDPAIHPNGYDFELTNIFRGGDKLVNVAGVLDYSYGAYVIQPTFAAEYIAVNPRPETPDVGGSLKVASFNVLNYFTTVDDGSDICGPAANMECRGADTAQEFQRQHDKIVAALAALDADIIGLIEIENSMDDSATATLVDGLNDVVGAGAYNYIATGAIGTDAIRVAFIYRSSSAKPVGSFSLLDTSVDVRFNDDKNRPALAQSFQDMSGGGVFTVTVNHFKSKGSACDDIGDPDTGDGAGNCNLTRTAAAEALVDWLATDPTGSGSTRHLIIGDLNSYDKEDPVATILKGADDTAGSDDDFIDLLDTFEGEYSYSYVYDGQLGYLDHALANASIYNDITGAAVWHINSDEVDLLDYDMTYKEDAQARIYAPDGYRSSDHDAVLIGLSICEEVAPEAEVTLAQKSQFRRSRTYVVIEATVDATDNFTSEPMVELISFTASSTSARKKSHSEKNIVIIDDTHFLVKRGRAMRGHGETYTAIYKVTDDCGNSSTAQASVTVTPYGRLKSGM